MTCTIETLSEDTLLLRFGDSIDAATNARVHAAARALCEAALPGVVDIAPAYATLLVRFDPSARIDAASARSFDDIATRLRSIVAGLPLPQSHSPLEGASTSPTARERDSMEIPVCYGGKFGPDLEAVAAHTGMSTEEVVARHSAGEYIVAMLGFAPGFPYLLGLDPALHVPRRATPRTRVPAGSVAIGGAQTGIYPCELPGGWNLIGRTPWALFDPQRESTTLLVPGDHVRFRAIDADEFARLADCGR